MPNTNGVPVPSHTNQVVSNADDSSSQSGVAGLSYITLVSIALVLMMFVAAVAIFISWRFVVWKRAKENAKSDDEANAALISSHTAAKDYDPATLVELRFNKGDQITIQTEWSNGKVFATNVTQGQHGIILQHVMTQYVEGRPTIAEPLYNSAADLDDISSFDTMRRVSTESDTGMQPDMPMIMITDTAHAAGPSSSASAESSKLPKVPYIRPPTIPSPHLKTKRSPTLNVAANIPIPEGHDDDI
eukprot:jgi/Hompol1/510/HPOL_000516-RA